MRSYAIVVTYNPNIDKLVNLVISIKKQGSHIIIVDNSDSYALEELETISNCHIIPNSGNRGIAYAQNIGVRFAKTQAAEVVTFFDQDSVISENMLHNLHAVITKHKDCVVCPVSIDLKSGVEYPSHRVNKYGLTKEIYSAVSSTDNEIDIAISSGMTAYMDTIYKVGEFDEDFFIDFVDIEWCLRCKKVGVKILTVHNAIMFHSIGDNQVKIGFLVIVMHNPQRTYYKVRNSFLLLRKDVNFVFAIRQIVPALFHNFLLVLFSESKCKYFRYYMIGILHGLLGRRGKYV